MPVIHARTVEHASIDGKVLIVIVCPLGKDLLANKRFRVSNKIIDHPPTKKNKTKKKQTGYYKDTKIDRLWGHIGGRNWDYQIPIEYRRAIHAHDGLYLDHRNYRAGKGLASSIYSIKFSPILK